MHARVNVCICARAGADVHALVMQAKITNMHEAKAEAMIAKLSNERTATGLASNSNRGPLGDGRAVNGQF